MADNNETITVYGKEYDAEDIIDVADKLLGDSDETGGEEEVVISDSGTLMAECDGWNDGDAYLYRKEGDSFVRSDDYTNLSNRRDEAVTAIEGTDFEAFVEQELDVEVTDVRMFSDSDVELDVTCHGGWFSNNKGSAIDNHDDIGIGYIAHGDSTAAYEGNPNDSEIYIGLKDLRDE